MGSPNDRPDDASPPAVGFLGRLFGRTPARTEERRSTIPRLEMNGGTPRQMELPATPVVSDTSPAAVAQQAAIPFTPAASRQPYQSRFQTPVNASTLPRRPHTDSRLMSWKVKPLSFKTVAQTTRKTTRHRPALFEPEIQYSLFHATPQQIEQLNLAHSRLKMPPPAPQIVLPRGRELNAHMRHLYKRPLDEKNDGEEPRTKRVRFTPKEDTITLKTVATREPTDNIQWVNAAVDYSEPPGPDFDPDELDDVPLPHDTKKDGKYPDIVPAQHTFEDETADRMKYWEAKDERKKTLEAKAAAEQKSVSFTTTNTWDGALFLQKKDPAGWKCDACYAGNPASAVKCLACETPKPGAAGPAASAASSGSSAAPSASNFTFGSSSNSAAKPAASGISFGSSTPAASSVSFGKPTAAPATGISFGTPAPAPAAPQLSFGSKPGASAAPSPSSDPPKFKFNATTASFGNPPAPTPGFSFGKDSTAKPPVPSFSDTNGAGSGSTPAATFGKIASKSLELSFGSKAKRSRESTASPSPTSTLSKKPIPSFGIPATSSPVKFSFGQKSDTSASQAPSLPAPEQPPVPVAFNNSTSSMEISVGSADQGASKRTRLLSKSPLPSAAAFEEKKDEPKLPSFVPVSKTSDSKPDFNFGASKDSSSSEKPSFKFGAEAVTTPPPTIGTSDMEPPKNALPYYQTGSKGLAGSSLEAPKKSEPSKSFQFGASSSSTPSLTPKKPDGIAASTNGTRSFDGSGGLGMPASGGASSSTAPELKPFSTPAPAPAFVFGGGSTTSSTSAAAPSAPSGPFGSQPAASTFGTTTAPSFGSSTQAPSTGFGGAPAPTTGFGSNSFGSAPAAPAFGSSAPAAPAFGSSAPAPSTFGKGPSFGSQPGGTSFGGSQAPASFGGTSAPSFGGNQAPAPFGSTTGFGATDSTTTGFGNAPAPGGFGAGAAPNGFNGSATAPPAFGSAPSFGGSGTNAPTPTFAFGSPPAAGTAPAPFGGAPTAPAAPSFSAAAGAGGFSMGAAPTNNNPRRRRMVRVRRPT